MCETITRASRSAVLSATAVLAVLGLGLTEGRAGEGQYDDTGLSVEQLVEVGMREPAGAGGWGTWNSTGDGVVDPERLAQGGISLQLCSAAREAGIKLSSKLLRLAKIV